MKKGSYYVKVVGPAGYLSLEYNADSLKNVSKLATSKSKAKLVKYQDESIFAATNNNKKDTFWFKIKTSEKDVRYEFEFLTTNHSKLRITLYDSKGKKIATDNVRPLEPGDFDYEYYGNYDKEFGFTAYFQSNAYKGPDYPYGTYYVKVEELNKDCNWAFRQ